MGEPTVAYVAELHGRSITDLLRAVVRLWGLYRGSLAAVFPPAVVAALDTLAAAIGVLEALNEPGPE